MTALKHCSVALFLLAGESFDSIKFLSPKYPIKKAYKINLFKVNLVLNKVDFW